MENRIIDGHTTNQKPLLNNGDRISDSELELIADTTVAISKILDKKHNDYLLNSINRFDFLLSQLEIEANLLSKEFNYLYDENDYINRLTLDYEVAKKEFISKYLSKPSILDRVMSILKFKKPIPKLQIIYYELLQLIPNLPNGELIEEMIFDRYFKDLVYESQVPSVSYEEVLFKANMAKDSIEKYYNGLNILKGKGVKSLTFHITNFHDIFADKPQDFLEFFNELKTFDLKILQFSHVYLSNILGSNIDFSNAFFDLIASLGLEQLLFDTDCGISNIYENKPNEFINIIKKLGDSGIKNLQLNGLNFNMIFGDNIGLFMEFIKTVGNSGIKCLDLSGCDNFGRFLNNPIVFYDFIKLAGESGIKHLNILLFEDELNFFNNNQELLLKIVGIAGMSGIKSFHFSSKQLFPNNTQGIDFLKSYVKIAGDNGIKVLDINVNGTFINYFDDDSDGYRDFCCFVYDKTKIKNLVRTLNPHEYE